jgi:Protein of unknown function (DUF4238)
VKKKARDNQTRNQHYVPQLVLRNFCTGGKLWVFDKHKETVFPTIPRNVMAERDFDSIEAQDLTVSFDNKFQFFEDKAGPIIRKIIMEQNLLGLSPMEQAELHMFIVLQHLRAKVTRRGVDMFYNEVKRRAPDISAIPSFFTRPRTFD